MKKSVEFFNVSLRNGHLMARPKHEPKFSFIGSLLLELERKQPEFLWMQMVFKKMNHEAPLRDLKSHLFWYKKTAEKEIVTEEGKKKENPLKRKEWYRTADARAKAIDRMLMLPHVVMSITGMWVGEKDIPVVDTVESCVDPDGIDSLSVFKYRDPRVLLVLAKRYIVDDLWEYFYRYQGGGRLEPPSFLLTSEDLPYYVHIPDITYENSVGSIEFRPPVVATKESQTKAEIVMYEGEGEDWMLNDEHSGMFLTSLEWFPKIEEKNISEKAEKVLTQIATDRRRSFEVVFSEGKALFLIGAETQRDLIGFTTLFTEVYGGMDFKKPRPVLEMLRPYLKRKEEAQEAQRQPPAPPPPQTAQAAQQ